VFFSWCLIFVFARLEWGKKSLKIGELPIRFSLPLDFFSSFRRCVRGSVSIFPRKKVNGRQKGLGILDGMSKILLGKHEKRRLLTGKRTRIFEKFQFRHVGGRQKPGVFRGFFD